MADSNVKISELVTIGNLLDDADILPIVDASESITKSVRVDELGAHFSGSSVLSSTDSLSEGTSNLYFTDDRVEAFVDSAYVQARQSAIAGLDSSDVISIVDPRIIAGLATVDSAYIISRVTSGDLDMNGNKVLFSNVYSQLADLPSATDNHGMFAHVHATGEAYYAHAGNWVQLAKQSAVSAGHDSALVQQQIDSSLSGGANPFDQDLNTTDDVEFNKVASNLDGAVIFKAKNESGSPITKGEAVYISGVSGNTPLVDVADASDSDKMPAFGIAMETASDNSEIEIVTFGDLAGVDTQTYTVGDTLFVGTTPGQITNVKPTGAATKIQNIAYVTKVDNNTGRIKVGGAGRSAATPNLDPGQIFYGNDSGRSTPTLMTDVVDSAYVQARQIPETGYATTVGYNPADVSDTSSYVLRTYDNLTPATFRGDVIDDSGNIIVDVSSAFFSGTVMGSVAGNVTTPDGGTIVLDPDNSVLTITDITANGTVDLSSATVLGVDQSIESLTDTQVVTANLNTDDFLRWNGSEWIGSPFNIEPALEFAGSIDATVDSAPSVSHGVLYAQVGAGTILPSWTGIAGQSIDSGMGLAWAEADSAWHIIGNITDAGVMSVVAGDGILVDDSVPARPVIAINRTAIQDMIDSSVSSSGYTTANFNDDLATKNTDNLYQGITNLYYSDSSVQLFVDSAYVQLRQASTGGGGHDSALIQSQIDSAIANYNWNTTGGDFHDSAITGDQIDSALEKEKYISTVNGVGPSASGDIGIHGGNTQTDAGSGVWIADDLAAKVRRITDTNTGTNYNPTNGVVSLPLATTSSVQTQIDTSIGALKFQDSADVATVVDPKLQFGGSSQMTILHASWDASGGTTIPTILSSYGVSNITRISEGRYQVDFMTNMVNANYTVTTGCGTNDYSGTGASPRTVSIVARANSSVTVLCERTDDAVNEDNEYMSVMIIGNQVSS